MIPRGARVGAVREDSIAGRALEYPHLRVANRVRVVVHVDAFDVRLALRKIQRLDVILLPLMKIYRPGMNEGERAREIHLADNFGFAGDVHNHEIVRSNRPQTHGVGRIGLLRPVPMVAAAVQKAGLGQEGAKFGDVHTTVCFSRGDGQFECCALQVIYEDFQIIGLHESVLRRAFEKIARMLHDKLVQRRRGRYQDGAGAAAATSCAASSLPGGRDCSGISRHDCDVQRTYVYTQLQRVG